MPDDIIKRMNYFDRQFLRAQDFKDEQKYHIDRRRRHNRLLHTPGVAEGLDVNGAFDAQSVTVQPGTAIDANGQEIVLAQQYPLPMRSDAQEIGIYILYDEKETDESSEGGVEGNTRKTEIPTFKQIRFSPPYEIAPALSVLLATVELNGGKLKGPPDNSVRTRCGTVLGDDFTVQTLRLKRDDIAQDKWPKMSAGQEKEATLEGSLRIRGKDEIKTNPDFKLHIQDSVNTSTGLQLRVSNIASGSSYSYAVFSAEANAGEVCAYFYADGLGTGPLKTKSACFGSYTNHPVGLLTSGKERLRIDTDGKVGIGTPASRATLDVSGDVKISKSLSVGSAASATVDNSIAIGAYAEATSDGSIAIGRDITVSGKNSLGISLKRYSPTVHPKNEVSNDGVMAILNGNVGIGMVDPQALLHVNGAAIKPGGGTWSTLSDKRLKKNVKPMDGVLNKLLQLRGISFEWKEPAKHGNLTGKQVGLIADEVKEVFPDWVDTGPDGFMNLTVRGFEALTIEALREMHQAIEELTTKNKRLEEKISTLEEALKDKK